MTDATDFIAALDDATARRILATVAQARGRGAATPPEPTAELGRELAEAMEVTPTGEPETEGEVARLALRLLAEDPGTREAIVALATSEPPQKLGATATIAVTTAVLMVLQTDFRFTRGKDGKWSFAIHKKPTTEALLKPLVQKLLSLFPTR